jgi:1-acyl-sn-glycerol-3-phosphate acyltransferase
VFVNAAIVFLVLSMLFGLEFVLVVKYFFTPKRSRDHLCATYEQFGTKIIFKLFRVFRGFRITVLNPKKLNIPNHCLVISNHQSLLDILVLIQLLGIERKPRFVAKKELQYGVPLVSFTLRKGGHCLIRRHGAPLETMRAVSKMAQVCMQERTCLVIFPEGTRSRNGELGVFHSAGVRKILDVEPIPVAAIAIEGGWRVATVRDFLRRFGKEPYVAEIVKIYDTPRGKHEIEKVLADAHVQIAARIDALRRR